MNLRSEDKFADRVRANQRQLGAELAARYDYVVCGGGTSGSVVAGRLAADRHVRVLLLEAGGNDELELINDPNSWPRTLGSGLDWGFLAEQNPRLNGRAIPYSMGKVLGGGSSINVATWSRGHRADWDSYASESNDLRWSYERILKLYCERVEAWTGRDDPSYRGSNGMVHVQPAANPSAFSTAFLQAAASAGLPQFPDANGSLMEAAGGCAFVDETVRDGRRQSIFRAYLYPLMAQPNITVLTGAHVARVLFEGGRACAVLFRYAGQELRVDADREVVLSLGAINTPKVLMQSGIGDATDLKRLGIPQVQSLPGVGRNLHDHVAFGCVWQGREVGLPPVPRSATVCYWKSDSGLDSPNLYAFARLGADVTPENAARFKLPERCWSFVVGLRPASRGTVRLSGPGVDDPVIIDANFLGDPADMKSLIDGLALVRTLGRSEELRPFTASEIAPATADANALEQFFRDGARTFWHQCGTAKMGCDAMSVVDGELKVFGIDGLRIADASVLPRVTVGNTMAPCVIVGEQAAAFLQAAR